MKHLLSILVAICTCLIVPATMQAQVVVNAPSGLNNRSTTKKPATTTDNKKADDKKAADKKTTDNNKKADNSGKKTADKKNDTEKNNKTTSQPTTKANVGKAVAGRTGGYRIQAYNSRDKVEANNRARKIAMKFPQYRTYLSYKAPSWRLRLGDFTDEDDARSALARMRRTFPAYASGMTIVREKVNVWK